jgi:hypothetical protein
MGRVFPYMGSLPTMGMASIWGYTPYTPMIGGIPWVPSASFFRGQVLESSDSESVTVGVSYTVGVDKGAVSAGVTISAEACERLYRVGSMGFSWTHGIPMSPLESHGIPMGFPWPMGHGPMVHTPVGIPPIGGWVYPACWRFTSHTRGIPPIWWGIPPKNPVRVCSPDRAVVRKQRTHNLQKQLTCW